MSAVSLALAGCSEDVMDRINQDTSHTNSVDGKFILADLITSTAFSNVSGDFNTYSSSYVEYEVGIENQLYNAEIRLNEPSASSTFENTYNSMKLNHSRKSSQHQAHKTSCSEASSSDHKPRNKEYTPYFH